MTPKKHWEALFAGSAAVAAWRRPPESDIAPSLRSAAVRSLV